MSQPSAIAALQYEVVRPKNTQEGEENVLPAGISLQSLPTGSPKEAQDGKNTGYWPQREEVRREGMIPVSPDSCIFPHIGKH